MKFTTVGWGESLAGTTAYKGTAALLDETVTVSGDIIYCPSLEYMIGVAVVGGTIGTNAYVKSPSLREMNYYEVGNIITALNPADMGVDIFHPENAIKLEKDEGIELFLKESTTTTEIRNGAIFLSDGSIDTIQGEIYTIHATATITSVTGQWVNGAITLDQTLPTGRFRVVGARCQGATGCFFRLVFKEQANRPGGLCVTTPDAVDVPLQRMGGLGVWGEFDSRNLPSLEMTAGTAAAQSPQLWLDVQKVS